MYVVVSAFRGGSAAEHKNSDEPDRRMEEPEK